MLLVIVAAASTAAASTIFINICQFGSSDSEITYIMSGGRYTLVTHSLSILYNISSSFRLLFEYWLLWLKTELNEITAKRKHYSRNRRLEMLTYVIRPPHIISSGLSASVTKPSFHPKAIPITIPPMHVDDHIRKPAILSPMPSRILFTSLHTIIQQTDH